MLLVAVGALFVAALLGSSRDSRDDRTVPAGRGGRLVERLAAVGAPPWTVTGVRMALPARDGRVGRRARRFVAIAASVALLVGVVTFGASMRRLVTTPELRGWTWDVEVGNFSDPESTEAARRLLAANPDVELAAGYSDEILDLDGRQVTLVGLERPAAVGVPVFEGRLPVPAGRDRADRRDPRRARQGHRGRRRGLAGRRAAADAPHRRPVARPGRGPARW